MAEPYRTASGSDRIMDFNLKLSTDYPDYTDTMTETCSHLDQMRPVTPSAEGCEDCLRIGGDWVHLRLCMTCGHVGCCDSSPNKHATRHFHSSGHPIIKSFQPGEDWGWCYVDEITFDQL